MPLFAKQAERPSLLPRPTGVREILATISTGALLAGCATTDAGSGCNEPKSRALPIASPSTHEVVLRAGDPQSGFSDVNGHFYAMPRRTPVVLPGGATRITPYLPGVPDGEYRATFVRAGGDAVTMTLEGRKFTLEGPLFCD